MNRRPDHAFGRWPSREGLDASDAAEVEARKAAAREAKRRSMHLAAPDQARAVDEALGAMDDADGTDGGRAR